MELNVNVLLCNEQCTKIATPPERLDIKTFRSQRNTLNLSGKYTLLECPLSNFVSVKQSNLYGDSSIFMEMFRLFVMLRTLS